MIHAAFGGNTGILILYLNRFGQYAKLVFGGEFAPRLFYQSKDGTSTKSFDALDWLAQLLTHVPNKGEQMVRWYGFYSKKSRGLHQKAGTEDKVPALTDSDISHNSPKSSMPPQKITVDNQARFRYQVGYWFRIIDASICGAKADADIQLTVFESSSPEKQFLIYTP